MSDSTLWPWENQLGLTLEQQQTLDWICAEYDRAIERCKADYERNQARLREQHEVQLNKLMSQKDERLRLARQRLLEGSGS